MKLKISQAEFNRLKLLLDDTRGMERNELQVDEYFSSTNGFFDEEFPYQWISLRQRGDRHTLSYKHFYPERAEVHDYCDETDVIVSDPIGMKRILTALGMCITVVVKKRRFSYHAEEVLIVLDDVAELGFYVEIEAKERQNVQIGIAAINAAVDLLQIDYIEQDHRGYPFRLLQLTRGKP